MCLIEFFDSHAGKAVVGVSAAVFLLAWPPALPWIAAVALLQFGVRHLVLAFKEVERDHTSAPTHHTRVPGGVASLAAPDDRERRLDFARNGVVPARSPLD
jgi:hypothetical protein